MTELQQYLRSYMGVSAEDMDALTSYFYSETLEKGGFFLKRGRICNKMSFHRSGLIRVYAPHGEKEVTQWISFKGNLITDLDGLLRDQPAMFEMRALTECELYTIDKKDYLSLSRTIPRWPELERLLLARCFRFMEIRLFALLSMSAEERYQYLQTQHPDLFNQVPLKYLASMMGMTPESLSRIRRLSMETGADRSAADG